jgi:CHAT domain-containing protein
VIKDLGDAARIDTLVTAARDLIYKAQGQVYSPAAVTAEERLREVTSQMYDLVFAPLAEASNGESNLIISPDGMLNLLPFEILPAPDGSYVIENYRISYLSSGRDLLKYKGDEPHDGEMIVMADPAFDGTADLADAAPSPTMTASVSEEMYGPEMRGITDCLETSFSPLGHTRQEAQSVAGQLKAARMPVREFYDVKAAEDALKNLQAPPQVLHLATHGFFCETGEPEASTKDNPLLRSGLVLTGANKTIAGESDPNATEDGILTALEVSGLNLVGTDLAVLSACESGMGDFVNGEGLFGLRRAFQHAGVETIIMSLWSVPDKETSQLMDGFYRRWLEGSSKRDALRESALEVLAQSREKRGCGHPLLWGGFILAGNPN